MLNRKIRKDELNSFYQSKFDYFRVVSGYSAILIGLLEMSYFISDCILYGRFATETVIPRFSIVIPLILFLILYPRIIDYKWGTLLYYLMPHAAMWCTIWAIYHLENRDYAREGFIIMHFAFLAIGFATPLKYHIVLHALLMANIIISNMWNHYEYYTIMLALAIPLYIGVVIMLWILENSYADQYLVKKQLEISSVSDELTGVNNRYIINKIIDPATDKFSLQKDIVVLMFDIDFFKKVNDTYGHEAGDEILKYVSTKIKSHLSKDDYIIRWGGEEFIIILVDCTINNALQTAEKLRSEIEQSDNGVCPITISMGLCCYDKNDTYQQCIDKADKALYYAKNHGRNQIVNYSDI